MIVHSIQRYLGKLSSGFALYSYPEVCIGLLHGVLAVPAGCDEAGVSHSVLYRALLVAGSRPSLRVSS